MSAEKIFSFLRGAVRGAYGKEDFKDKRILIVSLSEEARRLLIKLCFSGARLYFLDNSVVNLYRAHAVCGSIETYNNQPVDVVIDFSQETVLVRGRVFSTSNTTEDAYTQGIHEFYPTPASSEGNNEVVAEPYLGSIPKKGFHGGHPRDSKAL